MMIIICIWMVIINILLQDYLLTVNFHSSFLFIHSSVSSLWKGICFLLITFFVLYPLLVGDFKGLTQRLLPVDSPSLLVLSIRWHVNYFYSLQVLKDFVSFFFSVSFTVEFNRRKIFSLTASGFPSWPSHDHWSSLSSSSFLPYQTLNSNSFPHSMK